MVATMVVDEELSVCGLKFSNYPAYSAHRHFKPVSWDQFSQVLNSKVWREFGPARGLAFSVPSLHSLPERSNMQISMRPARAALRSGQARPVCMPAAARPALRLANTQQQRMAFQAPLEPSAQVHRGVTAQAAASSSASSSWPSAEKEQPRSWLATLSAHIARAAMLAGLVFAVVRCCCFPSCTCA